MYFLVISARDVEAAVERKCVPDAIFHPRTSLSKDTLAPSRPLAVKRIGERSRREASREVARANDVRDIPKLRVDEGLCESLAKIVRHSRYPIVFIIS